MNNYVFAIGGSGARCAEALIHLFACGLGPSKGSTKILFIDSDSSNGNLERARQLIELYSRVRNVLKVGPDSVFRTEFSSLKDENGKRMDFWNPIEQNPDSTFEIIFDHSGMKVDSPAMARLFEALFTADERMTPLGEGYRGHPAIGAAIVASKADPTATEFWHALENDIRRDITTSGGGARIFLFGSVFGGTGAAITPTFARLISELFEETKLDANKARVGGALLLPYFSFPDPPVSGPNSRPGEMYADCNAFLRNTQAALRYYEEHRGNFYNGHVYLLGNSEFIEIEKFAPGSREQMNPPHFIEWLSALGCLRFLMDNEAEHDGDSYLILSRADKDRLDWNDLPLTELDASRIKQFTRFAWAFNNIYFPVHGDRKNKVQVPQNPVRAPWAYDFLDGVTVEDKEIVDLRDYCNRFLDWIGQINRGKEPSIELVDPAALKSQKDEDFDNLVLPSGKRHPQLGDVWNRMCRRQRGQGRGLGLLTLKLYKSCYLS